MADEANNQSNSKTPTQSLQARPALRELPPEFFVFFIDMANALIDNSEQFKLVKYVKELVSRPDCNHIMIATGYWDLPGTALVYEELKGFFARGGKLDLLIGQEPQLQYYQTSQEVRQFPDFYIQRDVDSLTDEYKPIGKLIIDNALTEEKPDGKYEIRVYGQGEHKEFLHAKCYIFLGNNHTLATGIVGSSNFTAKGLKSNAELNYLEENGNSVAAPFNEYSTSKSHKAWFEELWQNSELWSGKFIKNILKPSPIGVEIEKDNEAENSLTPYDVYIKYLQTQFGDIIDAETTNILKTYLPISYKPLDYQLDAVKQGFSIMKRYGGFLLGDVVGLGKTVVGLLLIRMFLDQAEVLNRPRKVLVVVPPSIRRGWEDTIRDFNLEHATKIEPCIDFITIGSIGNLIGGEDELDGGDDFDRELDKVQYGLIMVDESHNFRNRGTQKYEALDELIGMSNPTPYLCLLSATPQNNTPEDLYNQITLFLRDANNCNLPNVPGGKLDSFFNAMKGRFKDARNMPADTPEQRAEAAAIIAEVSKEIRERVLNELVVRRTRTDIKRLYPEDSASLKFPTIKGPHKLEYHMDEELQQLFFDTINAIYPVSDTHPDAIQFSRYAAITFFKDKKNERLYEKRNLTVESITRRLQKIMKIMLVKRLESSIIAFKSSLDNQLKYLDVMISMLDHDAVYICPDIDVNKVFLDADGDFDVFQNVMERKIQDKPENNRLFHASDFRLEYREALLADRKIISRLLDRWNRNDFDPKFERFKQAIPELFNPEINNPSGQNKPRVVIFSEAIDTLKSIERALKNAGHRPLAITAENREEMARRIAENFDANLAPDKRRDDYDVIVTTEVLAEGVNLHRANIILNYDAPWNATRLMQRIGRVNRIGSVEDFVHVYNFFPSDEGNREIRLIEKAYAKLQSFHEMFGEDSKVFSEREEVRENDLSHTIDGDESPFGIYIRELKDFAAEQPEQFEYIKSLPLDSLGGYYPTEGCPDSLYIFTDQAEGLVSVLIADDSEPKASIISPLLTMQYLHCAPEARFTSHVIDKDALNLKDALRAYQNHVTHRLGGRDSNERIKDAQEYVRELRGRQDITNETKRLLAQVNTLVRNKNNFVIKTLLKQKQRDSSGQLSLFGADFEINSWLQTTFAHIATQAHERRGQSNVAIAIIK